MRQSATTPAMTSISQTALEFDGSGDYVDLSHVDPGEHFTVECWVKPESSADGQCFFSKHTSGGGNLIVVGYWNGGIAVYLPADNKACGVKTTGTWFHLAVVLEKTASSSKLSIYQNGELLTTSGSSDYTFVLNSTIPSLAGGKAWTLGQEWDSSTATSNFLRGAIAEVRIWNKLRTQTEIQAQMRLPLTGTESGLVGYWPLRDGVVKDLVSGQDGQIHGAPQTVLFEELQAPSLPKANVAPPPPYDPTAQGFGKLTELRVWDIALSPEEVAVNSKTRLSGNEPGLAAYYPMNEAIGNEVRDHSGNNRHAAMLAATWWGCTAAIGNLGHTVMQFDGAADTIETESLPFPTANYTIEGWFKTADPKQQQSILTLTATGSTANLSLQLNDDHLEYHISEGGRATSSIPCNDGQWHHFAAVQNGSQMMLYVDGKAATASAGSAVLPDSLTVVLGRYTTSTPHTFKGEMAEVRIWQTARTAAQITATRYQRLTGQEANLFACWPLTAFPAGKTPDQTENYPATVQGVLLRKDQTLPLSGDAVVSNEYSTITVDPVTLRKSAIMRRFYVSSMLGGVQACPEKRVEQLVLQWVGNAQFAPTLLGYIEGAPPIPSENLTESDDYNGATSVELSVSEDVEYSWNRTEESERGGSFEFFLGIDTEGYAGMGWEQKTFAAKVGAAGDFAGSSQSFSETNITASSSNSMTDSLELRGSPEQDAKFSHLGKRFIPKNVGYALVVSALADVFVTKLARSGRMVGYEVRPVDGIPPDVNTITFLMNPAYTMNGSLDGMTGSRATSQQFFRHVPEMRSQYGSLYPASYYRLKEAYDLKESIEREDKRRESYFEQFQLTTQKDLLDERIDSGDVPDSSLLTRENELTSTQSEEEQKAEREAMLESITEEVEGQQKEQSAKAKEKKAEIEKHITDQNKRVHASAAFETWQIKMEQILIRAGKRNIANTYVWDADGGLRAEAQSFASTVEHTIGSSFSISGSIGADLAVGHTVEAHLKAVATFSLTQTMSKTASRSRGIELNVDLSGVESIGVTDYNDYPLLPGEKVDRYRFMSFYLEGSTDNYHDFFEYVVHPEWLRSNDEEARALRQAMSGKANKTWRVLHRVTYVERPALMGFGREVRNLAGQEDEMTQRLYSKVEKLEQENKDLNRKLDDILRYLQQKLP